MVRHARRKIQTESTTASGHPQTQPGFLADRLIRLGLPLRTRAEDPDHGLAFRHMKLHQHAGHRTDQQARQIGRFLFDHQAFVRREAQRQHQRLFPTQPEEAAIAH